MNIKALEAVALSIRSLSMDGVQKANSGHPGLPMGCAELGALLYGEMLKQGWAEPENQQQTQQGEYGHYCRQRLRSRCAEGADEKNLPAVLPFGVRAHERNGRHRHWPGHRPPAQPGDGWQSRCD